MFDEFAKTIPAELTLRQRIKLHREHKFYEFCRDMAIVALLICSVFIFGGYAHV